MTAESLAAHGVNWLLTYLLHSTILLGGAWAISCALSSRFDSIRESLWKFALVAGIFSAAAQLALEPAGWSLRLHLPTVLHIDLASLWNTGSADQAAGDAPAYAATGGGSVVEPSALAEQRAHRLDDAAPWHPSLVPAAESQPTLIRRSTAVFLQGAPWAMALVLVGSLASLTLAVWRLTAMLAGRREVYDERIEGIFGELCRRAQVRRRVRLTHSPRLATPVAMGVLRAEICLPSRALERLGTSELESMLAHELAHIVRRDPLWMLIGQVMTTLLFVQPLNFIARRHLREIAEYRCDAWAAAQCADVLPLARCLTEVATWLVQARRASETGLLPGMSVRQSALSRRVGRLLDEPAEAETRGQSVLATGLIGALATLAVMAPGVDALARNDVAPPSIVMRETPTEPSDADAPAPISLRSDPLAALDEELLLLEREVGALKTSAAGTPLETEIRPLIEQFEMKAASIRHRRSQLQAGLDKEPIPDTPESVQEH